MLKIVCCLTILITFLFATSCKNDPPVVPPVGQPDTTSHLINWVVEDIGDFGSILRDVAIINDTLAYAVGEIHHNDTLYNLAKWNGQKWELKKVAVNFRGNLITSILEGIFAFSETKIWLIGSLPIFGEGTNWTMYDLRTTVDPDISVSKAWGLSTSSIYFAGRGGTIVHYDGLWKNIASGTTITLRDVWGSPDGSVVWAAGFEDSYGTVFLRNTGNGFEKVLEITNPNIPHPPDQITHVFKSLWTDKSDTVYLGAIGRVYAAPKNTTGYAKENIWWDYANETEFPPETNIIRGTAGNDIFVAGYNQFVRHWNGASWKGYPEIEGDGTWRSLAVNKNLIIAVGENFGVPGSARIAIGLRNK